MARSVEVEVNDQQACVTVDLAQIKQVVCDVLLGEGVPAALVSVALVDDPTLRRLNRQYLDHDYDTDVLSFPLRREEGYVEGEIVVSGQTAVRSASQYDWSAADELLLYVVHGCLHLVGYNDATADDRQRMRAREEQYLGRLGLQPKYDETL